MPCFFVEGEERMFFYHSGEVGFITEGGRFFFTEEERMFFYHRGEGGFFHGGREEVFFITEGGRFFHGGKEVDEGLNIEVY